MAVSGLILLAMALSQYYNVSLSLAAAVIVDSESRLLSLSTPLLINRVVYNDGGPVTVGGLDT